MWLRRGAPRGHDGAIRHARQARPALLLVLALCAAGTVGAGTYALVRAQDPGSRLHAGPGSPGTGSPGTGVAPGASRSPTVGSEDASPPREVVPPTLLVAGKAPIDGRQRRRVARLEGVQAVERFDAGQVRLAGRRANLLGVDPAGFRGWTPPSTAAADALWRAIARDELILAAGTGQARGLQAGRSYVVTGRRVERLELGGAAKLGLTGVDALVSRDVGKRLGLVDNLGLLVNAPGADHEALVQSLREVLGDDAQVLRLRGQVAPSAGGG